MSPPILLSVPNISEGRDQSTIAEIADAFTRADRTSLLDLHSDADHNRSVFTLAGEPNELSKGLLSGIRAAVERVSVTGPSYRPGVHPHVGAVDVVPLVYLSESDRGVACAQALVVADEIGRGLDVPVFLYGELADGRTRSSLRRGGLSGLQQRIQAGECLPDFGPVGTHPSAGATLVGSREPLVAFNLELSAGSTVDEARAIAARVREGGEEGLPGVRAIGVQLSQGVAQVSMNVERPLEVPLGVVVEAVRRHCGVARAELVGLVPEAALEGYPEDLPIKGFDPASHVIENALGF